VLEHLKKYNPSQIIIAYSGRTFDLSKTQFWKLADDTLSKPSDFITCKEVIDRLLLDKFNVSHYWSALKNIIITNGASNRDIGKIEKKLYKAIKQNKKISTLELFTGIIKTSEPFLKVASLILTTIYKIMSIT
jgi:hypothetical protein